MNVKQLIEKLLNFPMGADVVIDTDDGFKGNFQELRYAVEKKNSAEESFVVLTNDFEE